MPDIRCSECGHYVRVQGLAATCPHCGNLLTVAPLPGAEASPNPRHDTPAEAGSPSTPLAVSQQEPLHVIPISPQPATINYWKAIGIAGGVLIVLLITVDWIRVRMSSQATPQQVAVTPAPPVVNPNIESPRPAPATFPIATPKPAPAEPIVPAPAPTPTYPHANLARVEPTPPEHPPITSLTDQQVGDSIKRGVDFLLGQFTGHRLNNPDGADSEVFAGRDALAVYALLHAGQAINDPRLSPQTDFIKGVLDRLKEFPMDGSKATYSRALRLSALGVYSRPQDRPTIDQDAQYLLKSSIKGGFAYQMPPEPHPTSGGWDNSNSQYGALGLWAAADAGYRVPNIFWSEVESHWVESQTPSGAWAYGPTGVGNIALTAGGITSLFVARDQMIANVSELTPNAGAPRAIQRGIEWLEEADHAVQIPGDHPGYSLYGLERAGLASGYKFFATHDWYLELASKFIKLQQANGSWVGGDGTDVETSFVLLFLSRGRHPVLISKLEFPANSGANWANYARDLANLTRFAGKELERPLNWQVVHLNQTWRGWTDSAVVYLASDKAPALTDADVDQLRAFVEAGGLLFTHADKDSSEMTAFVTGLAKRLFPQYSLDKLPDDHVLYSALYPMQTRPPMLGMSNGVRLLMVHSPTDLAKTWQRRNDKGTNRAAFEMGVNVAIYASGRRELRNRVESIFVADPIDPPLATVPVARIRYNGNWDPEPGAWRRFPLALEGDTRLHLLVKTIDAASLRIDDAPLAVLTGVAAFKPTTDEIVALRKFVEKGGVLLIDACGGSKQFVNSVRSELLAKLSTSALATLPNDHPILKGALPGMEKANPLRVRPFTIETLGTQPAPPLQTLRVGVGQIIFSELDLTSGLLGTATWGIVGYQPSTSQAIVKNAVIWSIRLPPR